MEWRESTVEYSNCCKFDSDLRSAAVLLNPRLDNLTLVVLKVSQKLQ
jgi:hypothetical protein